MTAFPGPLQHALKSTERLAYGRGTLAEALMAWKPFNGGTATANLRYQYGMLPVLVLGTVNTYAMIKTMAWPPLRKREECKVLDALLKAHLALIFGGVGDIGAGESAPASPGEDKKVIDFKSRAAGERSDD